MRIACVRGVLLLLAACNSPGSSIAPGPAVTIKSPRGLCTEQVRVVCGKAAACCGADTFAPATCLEVLSAVSCWFDDDDVAISRMDGIVFDQAAASRCLAAYAQTIDGCGVVRADSPQARAAKAACDAVRYRDYDRPVGPYDCRSHPGEVFSCTFGTKVSPPRCDCLPGHREGEWCESSLQCSAGLTCASPEGRCRPHFADGAACRDSRNCASGHCNCLDDCADRKDARCQPRGRRLFESSSCHYLAMIQRHNVAITTRPATEALAVDDTHLYWADDRGLVRAAKNGPPNQPAELYWELQVPGQGTGVEDLAVDGDHIYVLRDRRLHRLAKTGGASTLEIADPDWVSRFMVDGDGIWIAKTGCRQIARLDRTLRTDWVADVPVTDGARRPELASDGTRVFCSADKEIHAVDKASHAVTRLVASSTIVGALAAEGDRLWFVDFVGGWQTSALKVVPAVGGEARTAHTVDGALAVLVWDPARQRFYYPTDYRRIMVFDPASARASVVTDELETRRSLSQDAGAVYWTSSTGPVRFGKPN